MFCPVLYLDVEVGIKEDPPMPIHLHLSQVSICLLESPPSPDALCDLLLDQLRDDRDVAWASARARLAALVYHYRPPRWDGGRLRLCPWPAIVIWPRRRV